MASKKQRQRDLERARYQRRMARREQRDAQTRKWAIGGVAAVVVLGLIAGAFFLFSGGKSPSSAAASSSRTPAASTTPTASATPSVSSSAAAVTAGPPLHVHEQPSGLPEGGNAVSGARLQGHVSGDNSHESRQYRH